eukprot:scaffold3443_cov219-Pinguiococcus_pyrenoidosus.AAC.2
MSPPRMKLARQTSPKTSFPLARPPSRKTSRAKSKSPTDERAEDELELLGILHLRHISQHGLHEVLRGRGIWCHDERVHPVEKLRLGGDESLNHWRFRRGQDPHIERVERQELQVLGDAVLEELGCLLRLAHQDAGAVALLHALAADEQMGVALQ